MQDDETAVLVGLVAGAGILLGRFVLCPGALIKSSTPTSNTGTNAPAPAPASSTPTPAVAPAPPPGNSAAPTATATTSAPAACSLRLDATGLTANGAPIAVADAVTRCKAAGRADMTVAQNAPAATYADLMIAFNEAGIAVASHRNARRAGRKKATRNADTGRDFTLRYYPEGGRINPSFQWFRSEVPITWMEARDRLIDAGIVESKLAGRTHLPFGWVLSTDQHEFSPEHAEPLPGASRADGPTVRQSRGVQVGDRVQLAPWKRPIPAHDGKPQLTRDTPLRVLAEWGDDSGQFPLRIKVTDGTHRWHLDAEDVVRVPKRQARARVDRERAAAEPVNQPLY